MKGERVRILDEAVMLVSKTRDQQHGNAHKNAETIAAGFSAIAGVEISSEQAMLMMAWVKIARAVNNPDHRDNYVDLAGYASLAGEVSCARQVSKQMTDIYSAVAAACDKMGDIK